MLASPRALQRKPAQEALDAADLRGANLAGFDLRGVDLAGRDLEGADLSEADLEGATLRGARLVGVNLARARAPGADLHSADLSGADLTAAFLAEAILTFATLEGARADAARFEGSSCAGASMRKLTARGAAFDGADLTGADLEDADLSFATLERARLVSARLVGARLVRCRFDGATLVGSDLARSDLDRAVLAGSEVGGASFEGARTGRLRVRRTALQDDQRQALLDGGLRPSLLSRAVDASGAWLSGVGPAALLERARALLPERPAVEEEAPAPEPEVLREEPVEAPKRKRHITQDDIVAGADLRIRDLREFTLRGLDLSGSDLRGADLRGMDLQDAVLADCRLDGARLDRADLSRADLSRSSAERAAFDEANLESASLRGLDAEGASFLGARFRGAEFARTSLVFANLSEADLRACQLDGLDIRGARLDRANMTGAQFDGLIATTADLGGAIGITPGVFESLRTPEPTPAETDVSDGVEARLSRAISGVAQWIRGGGLQDVSSGLRQIAERLVKQEGERPGLRVGGLLGPFAGSPKMRVSEDQLVPGAALVGTDLRGLKLAGLDLTECDLRGAVLDGMNLEGTRLSGADLSGASLVRARLHATDLAGTVLADARFDDAHLSETNLEGSSAAGLRAVGALFSSCRWQSADLFEACLRGASLCGEDLAGVSLRHADLELAELAGCDLSDASLDGADLAGIASLPLNPKALREAGVALPHPVPARLAQWLSLMDAGRRLAALLTRQLTRFAAFVREGGLRRPVEWVRGGGLQAAVSARVKAVRMRVVRNQPPAELLVPGAVLAGMELHRAKLAGLDLSDCVFDGAEMYRVDLRGATLRGATFVGARMEGARLDGADLQGADFEGAQMARASLLGVSLSGARLINADLEGAELVDTDVADANLAGARLAMADLAGAALGEARVDGADFMGALGVSDAAARELGARGALVETRADARQGIARIREWAASLRVDREDAPDAADSLRGQDLRERPLTGRDLAGADLRGARLDDMDLRGTVLAGARLAGASFVRARLDGADLSSARAEGADFTDAHLEGADLSGLDAREARLVGASLRGARLHRARLGGVDLSAADLTGTDLADVDLAGATLLGTLVDGAVLSRVVGLSADQVEELIERGGVLDSEAAIPLDRPRRGLAERMLDAVPGRRRAPPADLILGPEVDLSGRDLRRLVLAGLDLSGANLRDARLDGADLRQADLSAARLDGARLKGALLGEARLAGATAAEASFDDADLAGADLTGLRAPGGSFVGARFPGATFGDTSLVDCDLSVADLRGVDLADSDLSGAVLEQTELEGAVLDRVAAHGTDLVGALGLEAAQIEALTARGARVAALRLPLWARRVLAPRPLGLLATAAALVVGGVVLFDSAPQTGEALEGEAGTLVEIGEVDRAAEEYRALLAMTAGSSERIRIRRQIARIYEDDGQVSVAAEEYRAAIDEAETGEDFAETSLRLARLLGGAGDFSGERAAYGAVLTRIDTPSALYAAALVGLIDSHREEGHPEAADEARAEWLGTMDHNTGRALTVGVAMAEVWAAGGEYERALEMLEETSQLSLDADQRVVVLSAQAELHANRGDYSAADAIYTQLLRNPKVDRGRTSLAAAEVAWHLGESPRALELLDRALQGRTHPETEARVLLLKARVLRDSDDRESAIALYQRILAVHADDFDAYSAAQLGLAESLSEDEQLTMVDELLAAGDNAQASQILLSRARRARVTGDLDAAEAIYNNVLTLESPNEVRIARFELAQVAIETERTNEGINQLRAIQSEVEGPERVEVEAAIADALRAAGRLDDAEFAYSGLIAAYPEGSEASVRGLLGKARVSEARGRIEDARRGYLLVLDQTTSPTLRSETMAALAGNYMETGESDAALLVWREFLAELPEGHEASFDAREAIAQILRARGERHAALENYELLLRSTSSADRRARALVAVGELLEEDGRHGEAEELYRELLVDPALPEDEHDTVVVGLIRTLLSLERPEDALGVANSAEVYEPETEQTMRSLQAQALRSLGRTEEAARFEDQGEEVEQPEDEFSIALVEANELVNEWDFEGAVAAYEGLLAEAEDRPTQAMIRGAIAQAKGLGGDLDGSRAEYRALRDEFADLDEAVFSAEMGLAWVDRQGGNPEAAVERYAGIVGPDPGSEVWRLEQLATASLEVGDDEAAEAVYKDLIRNHAGDVFAQSTGRYGLAELLRNRGELAAARGLYEQVARSSPDKHQQTWAALHAAMILVDEGRLDDAEDHLDALLDETDDDEVRVQAAIGMSSIELERGRPGKALDALDDVDAERLGGGWVATLTQQRATCLVAGGDADEATREWNAVLRAYGDNDDIASQARLALGDLAVGQDAADDAIAHYDRVLVESGDPHYQARALLGRGDALAMLGRTKEAEASWRQVVDEYGEEDELAAIARAKL